MGNLGGGQEAGGLVGIFRFVGTHWKSEFHPGTKI